MQTRHSVEGFYKPVVKIKDAAVLTSWDLVNRLTGIVEDYPADHMHYEGCVTNGKPVCTSKILKIRGWYVETERTVYFVQNWVEVPLELKTE